jgi:flagellar motor protein MotB
MQAQFGKALGKAIENAAKNATVRKAEQKTDQAVSKSIDKATSPDTYKGDDKDGGKGSSKNSNSKSGAEDENSSGATGKNGSAPQGVKAAEMAYAKNDFVPGDEIIFDDPMDNEKVGEFPSQWDLLRGNSEVVVVNGKKGFELSGNQDAVCPLMKNPKNYLGDVFTVEFDFLSVKAKNQNTALWYTFCFLKPDEIMGNYGVMYFTKAGSLGRDDYRYRWQSNNGSTSGDADLKMEPDVWHHIAISFNKRAWKMYINGVRIINVPNVSTPPGWMCILMDNVGEGSFVFTNFRIAKGAVPLYDRLASEGKIITYGITFDVGKSTIKPESMTEINRIATLMKENPDLKFSVEGHTDNTGNAASNQTLSEARSQAVVDKLVELGIAKDRLKAAGKGQTSPISDNSTDEGRAKNRRVEFVKIN